MDEPRYYVRHVAQYNGPDGNPATSYIRDRLYNCRDVYDAFVQAGKGAGSS